MISPYLSKLYSPRGTVPKGPLNVKVEVPKVYKVPEGNPVPKEEVIKKFETAEGSINFYYGRIGSGKTYAATADILQALKRGEVCYANWRISFDSFDQRNNFFFLLLGMLKLKKVFYCFPSDNYHFFNPDEVDIEWLSSLTDCRIWIDEGQWIFDSYEGTKFSKAKRRLILHTRHCNRELNIISQRPSAIQVSARGNCNRFYKCEKILSWPLILRRTEYQEMALEMPDETKPSGRKTYFGSSQVFDAYNSRYLRGGIPMSQEVYFQAFRLSIKECYVRILTNIGRALRRVRPAIPAGEGGSTVLHHPRTFSRPSPAGATVPKDVGGSIGAASLKREGQGTQTAPLRRIEFPSLPF